MHDNDCLNATAKREKEEAEREIRVKGTVLDAYHQRELKWCNRSKEHPWAVKSRSGWVEGNAQGKACSRNILDQFYFGEGGGGWPNQTIHRH